MAVGVSAGLAALRPIDVKASTFFMGFHKKVAQSLAGELFKVVLLGTDAEGIWRKTSSSLCSFLFRFKNLSAVVWLQWCL